MNRRIFVEKKEQFNAEASALTENFASVLSIKSVSAVRAVNIYDIFGIDAGTFEKARGTVFSEPPTDILYTDCIYGADGDGGKTGGIYGADGKNGMIGLKDAGGTDRVGAVLDLRGKIYFAVEPLPGQYDQRGESAEQCLRLINTESGAKVGSGKLIILDGAPSAQEVEFIKKQLINPIESREKDLSVLAPPANFKAERAVRTVEGFNALSKDGLGDMKREWRLAMNDADLAFIQSYFKNTEKREPSEAEIKVLDTYWSDHCRHTTFETELVSVKFPEGKYGELFRRTFERYRGSRKYVYGDGVDGGGNNIGGKGGGDNGYFQDNGGRGGDGKPRAVTLMDLATISGKEMRKNGTLNDIELSGEVNACSVYTDAEVNGKIEKWILQFKNETHNHPTEIEPFGGASTCIGGAIRDPLSGRAYVYQSMRVSGAANPLTPVGAALKGKLPQRVITQKAARGFSSYGNQIGLAAAHVSEIYHGGYEAKRLEAGFVMGAVKAEYVRREEPAAGDVVILLGGRTGRDGIGGATGSSKEHNAESTDKSASEVQKGNAPEERKIQRLFRKPEATRLIKKCNDFGAGGVSVAIGELADGVLIDLNKVALKYEGLNGTEIAISESQERMAVVTAKADAERFIALAAAENLEAAIVAEATELRRLQMVWDGVKIVDISRDFLNTNGVRARTDAEITAPCGELFKNTDDIEYEKRSVRAGTEEEITDRNTGGTEYADNETIYEPGLKVKFLKNLSRLNVASQKGLVEMFDNTIGASTVLMPFGGAYADTPTDVSVQKLPVNGETSSASIAAYGYNPYLTSRSPFHGALYAVVESVAKIVAAGAGHEKIRFTFQEYFEKPGGCAKRWGKPLAALLGAYYAQQEFGLPSIGGKDSMSGTFNDLNVPPTLISFAVKTTDADYIISPEFKRPGSNIYLFYAPVSDDGVIDFVKLKENFHEITRLIRNGTIKSAMAVRFGGVAEALAKMSFGNKVGFEAVLGEERLFDFSYGSIVAECAGGADIDYEGAERIGRTTDGGYIALNGEKIEIDEALSAWTRPLESVFPPKKDLGRGVVPADYSAADKPLSKIKYATPKVVIPAFYGTNCEYDSERAFILAGGRVTVPVFLTLTPKMIEESALNLAREIGGAQIIMFPGGFSAGDEPDGSAKYIVNVIRNARIADALREFLEKGGLILGICNGFQALIKSGLLQHGRIEPQNAGSATLTYNVIGRHASKIVPVRIASNKSPWFYGFEPGDVHRVAVSHGEGRLIVPSPLLSQWREDGRICAQYADLSGAPTMLGEFNPNGSVMAIEAICSPDGRILGRMGHSERMYPDLYKNIRGDKNRKIFENGIKYFA
ncbi:MAG: phosphoribosylformylglycinamidine synthase [Clostridiales bacterium]|jgi:phosphoribosylformylglycinamidine synthase|nr:phosphoribosylformylglycinamidine synthase [Clostridiales bacterium]